jgi:methylenetetrahydrofolate--tRNA-(uracil-5-)-methyltransferase
MRHPDVLVIGGGLAGCEAAWQLAEAGLFVSLVEMKPAGLSPAHQSPLLGELVCSNTLRSNDTATPAGLLKAELRACGSLIVACADAHRVPAGDALAVERTRFSREITKRIALHRNIRLERRVVHSLVELLEQGDARRGRDGAPALSRPPMDLIVATGPLTGGKLAAEIQTLCGKGLYFYDAIAPIVDAETIDWSIAYRASRWDKGTLSGGDYVNCPMNRAQYEALVEAIRAGRKVAPHRFEEPRYFEGCLPVEVMAERGMETLAHGPLRPVGLADPRQPDAPMAHAVVQLRAENGFGTSYNLVGFQTRLTYPEQKRIFRMIPGLQNAEFLRFGSVHRNAYIESHRLLGDELELRSHPRIHFAGQLTGVEGYIESTAMGLLVGQLLAARRAGRPMAPPPPTTALGALLHHALHPRQPGERLEPSNINFGLFPPPPATRPVRGRRRPDRASRRQRVVDRALGDLASWRQGALEPVGATAAGP